MNKSSYDKKAKERTMRYMAESRERFTMNFAKGTKIRYRAFAEFCGKSFTALVQELIEREIRNTPEYDEESYLKGYFERLAKAEADKLKTKKVENEKTVTDN